MTLGVSPMTLASLALTLAASPMTLAPPALTLIASPMTLTLPAITSKLPSHSQTLPELLRIRRFSDDGGGDAFFFQGSQVAGVADAAGCGDGPC